MAKRKIIQFLNFFFTMRTFLYFIQNELFNISCLYNLIHKDLIEKKKAKKKES